jgi:hypothetical protein
MTGTLPLPQRQERRRRARAQTTFAVSFRAPAGGAGIRSLRSLLKHAWRNYSLRAISVCETVVKNQDEKLPTVAGAGGRRESKRATKDKVMDMSKYAGTAFISLDDVRDAPMRGKIAWVEVGQYDKPVITFENGLRFSLNVSNVQRLMKDLGPESDDWIGETIELAIGQVKFKDGMVDSVIATVVPREPGAAAKKLSPPKPKKRSSDDIDDQVAF